MQELQMSTAAAREPARSALMCEDFAPYLRHVIDGDTKSVSSKQILNIDQPGVTARPFKGKK
jgi:hypothetical protein